MTEKEKQTSLRNKKYNLEREVDSLIKQGKDLEAMRTQQKIYRIDRDIKR